MKKFMVVVSFLQWTKTIVTGKNIGRISNHSIKPASLKYLRKLNLPIKSIDSLALLFGNLDECFCFSIFTFAFLLSGKRIKITTNQRIAAFNILC